MARELKRFALLRELEPARTAATASPTSNDVRPAVQPGPDLSLLRLGRQPAEGLQDAAAAVRAARATRSIALRRRHGRLPGPGAQSVRDPRRPQCRATSPSATSRRRRGDRRRPPERRRAHAAHRRRPAAQGRRPAGRLRGARPALPGRPEPDHRPGNEAGLRDRQRRPAAARPLRPERASARAACWPAGSSSRASASSPSPTAAGTPTPTTSTR